MTLQRMQHLGRHLGLLELYVPLQFLVKLDQQHLGLGQVLVRRPDDVMHIQ